MNAGVQSLLIVLAGAALVPFGLRAVNRLLPGAEITASYLPSIEAPRQREPFDEATATAVRDAQPEFVVIGDSMAGVRINPASLSKQVGRTVAGLYHPGSPVAYWYLAFKNLVVQNELRNLDGAVFFFRDDQLTTQVVVDPLLLDRVARAEEPELDRALAAHRLGRFSGVHRTARSFYQYDRTRVWLEPRLTRLPALAADDPAALLERINADVFALDRLRSFEASDLAATDDAVLEFSRQVDRSLLPEILRLADEAKIRVAFVRAQRRPTAAGPPPQSEALTAYLRDLERYLVAHGAYYHDDRGDPAQPLSIYADGDHLTGRGRELYTEQFAQRHARFFQ